MWETCTVDGVVVSRQEVQVGLHPLHTQQTTSIHYHNNN
jgi:hypothetical protein